MTFVCAAFAFKALFLVDATSLWIDELSSAGKSFQSDYSGLVAWLRRDTHPPFYYTLLWFWGGVAGKTSVSLRLFSWLAYALGGVLVIWQAGSLALRDVRGKAMACSALLFFCSPYPVRFAIEGKSYAFLVLLIALGWFLRSRCIRQQSYLLGFLGYGFVVAAASLTHFYGLFIFFAAGVWDVWRRRWRLGSVVFIALVPSFAWVIYASSYLFGSSAGAWIGRPDFALFEDTLARAIGPWPLPKLVLFFLVLLGLRRWGVKHVSHGFKNQSFNRFALMDVCGLTASAIMVVGLVAISFFKPMAFSRYFVVLLPAVIPWLAVTGAQLHLNRRGSKVVVLLSVIVLLLWWQQSFLGINGVLGGSRESDNFRAVSLLTAGQQERYSPRPRLLQFSDQVQLASGRIAVYPAPWGGPYDLNRRLQQRPLPTEVWLATSGPEQMLQKGLLPLETEAAQAGLSCEALDASPAFTRVLRCRLTTTHQDVSLEDLPPFQH
ncbi:glycosyltransferase family 39 protein [Synechococcus sp. MIT S9508]|uniref:glycosyltransferase family 39 protein n=1 Tax=Synechococcus sp. MIT S9508 TaxID=1801629 RepID=UPI001E3F427B|nr:glycosyltransferase family 39 protein [Synechococcus sp. MIT S9508]